MTNDKTAKATRVNLGVELEQEEKAVLKAQSLDLLRVLKTKLSQTKKNKAKYVKEEEEILTLRAAIYAAFESADSEALDELSSKIR